MDVVESGIEPAQEQNLRRIAPSPRAAEASSPAVPVTAIAVSATRPAMSSSPRLRQFLIVGVTRDGKTFRPSDWSERLAGAMSAFRPGGSAGGIAAFIGYSPYCVPRTVDGHKCVLVNEALRSVEVMAWDFVMHFARDNELEVRDVTPPADR
jgi:hypothetical protein